MKQTDWTYSSSAREFVMLATLLLTISLATPARAADDACKPISDSGRKVMLTPAHSYIVGTGGYHKSKPDNSESIYAGGTNGAIYVMVGGKWTRSKITVGDLLKQQEENIRTVKATCRYLRDEVVNGEAAAVYASHTETDDMKSDSTVWISKSRGLPLRSEMDLDVGGALGKSHTSIRYDYTNVRPPAGVQ